MTTQPTVYVGTTLDGTPALVTVWPGEGNAELAFKDDGRWGPPVELIEEVPSSSEYACRFRDARFGIAGTFTGSDDDYAAEEYHRAEVDYHEAGERRPGAALAEKHIAETKAAAGMGVA
jgi:hypothetical protein